MSKLLKLCPRCFSHGARAGDNLSSETGCPVRAVIHSCPSGKRNGVPVSRLITPSSLPAKWTRTDDESGGWLVLGELLTVVVSSTD